MNKKRYLLAALLVCLQTSTAFATADTFRVIRSGNLKKTASPIVTDLTVEGTVTLQKALVQKNITLADGATSLDASLGSIFVTQANTGATVLASISNPVAGQIITIIGGSDTNSTTLADAGNFKLSGAMTFSAKDSLTLCIIDATNFVEVGRTNN